MDTAKVYLPWTTTSEGGDMNAAQRSLLTPFKMTLNKLYFRPETLNFRSRVNPKKQRRTIAGHWKAYSDNNS